MENIVPYFIIIVLCIGGAVSVSADDESGTIIIPLIIVQDLLHGEYPLARDLFPGHQSILLRYQTRILSMLLRNCKKTFPISLML